MSIQRGNSKVTMDAVSSDDFNRQAQPPDKPGASGRIGGASALASSPVTTPVKIKTPKARLSSPTTTLAAGDDSRDSSPRPPETPVLDDEESPIRPAKRQKVDLGTHKDIMLRSPTPEPTIINTANSPTKITMIKSNELVALRDHNTQLRDNNKSIAKENAKLRQQVAKLEKEEAISDVFEVENKRLERELETQIQENEDLQVTIKSMAEDHAQQMSVLRQERSTLEGVTVWWAGQEQQWLQEKRQLRQAAEDTMRSCQDLQAENQRLAGECARLNNLFAAPVEDLPELPDEFLNDL